MNMRLVILVLSGFMLASFLAPTYSQWTQAYYSGGGFNGFCFPDSLNGWFTHQGTSKIIHTSDGGYTFDVQSVTPGQYTLNAVYMEDQFNGWAAGQGISGGPGIIHHTINGGSTWVQISHPAPNCSWSSIAEVGNHIYFGGGYGTDQGIIMKTSDNGQNWEVVLYPNFGIITGITVFDSANYVINGTSGLLARTTDNGISWVSVNLPSDYQVERVTFVNQIIGYALISTPSSYPPDAYLYKSTDSGFTWNLIYSWVDQGQKQGLSVIPETNTLFVCGMLHAAIPYSYGVLKSTDSGLTWNTVMQSSTNSPMQILTLDMRHGWGSGGANIYRYDYVTPPTIEPISNQLIQFGDPFTYQVNATGLGLKYSMTNNPPGLAIGLYSGFIDGTPTVGGKYQITVAAQDTDINVVNEQFRLKVNRRPHFLAPIPDTLAFVDSIYYTQINAEDLDGDTLSVRPLSIPSFLNMYVPIGGSTLAVLEGTPDSSDIGYHNISIEVLDNYGGKDTLSWRLHVTSKTTFIDDINAVPNEFMLYQNYPNPFNPRTKIVYSIPSLGAQSIVPVQLKVYDVLGNEIIMLVDEFKPSGFYEIEFDAASLSSGVYFYELKAGEFLAVKRMLMMK